MPPDSKHGLRPQVSPSHRQFGSALQFAEFDHGHGFASQACVCLFHEQPPARPHDVLSFIARHPLGEHAIVVVFHWHDADCSHTACVVDPHSRSMHCPVDHVHCALFTHAFAFGSFGQPTCAHVPLLVHEHDDCALHDAGFVMAVQTLGGSGVDTH